MPPSSQPSRRLTRPTRTDPAPEAKTNKVSQAARIVSSASTVWSSWIDSTPWSLLLFCGFLLVRLVGAVVVVCCCVVELHGSPPVSSRCRRPLGLCAFALCCSLSSGLSARRLSRTLVVLLSTGSFVFSLFFFFFFFFFYFFFFVLVVFCSSARVTTPLGRCLLTAPS